MSTQKEALEAVADKMLQDDTITAFDNGYILAVSQWNLSEPATAQDNTNAVIYGGVGCSFEDISNGSLRSADGFGAEYVSDLVYEQRRDAIDSLSVYGSDGKVNSKLIDRLADLEVFKDPDNPVCAVGGSFSEIENASGEIAHTSDIDRFDSAEASKPSQIEKDTDLNIGYVTDIKGNFFPTDAEKSTAAHEARDAAPISGVADTQIVEIGGEFRPMLEFAGVGRGSESRENATRVAESLLDALPDEATGSIVTVTYDMDISYASVALPAGIDAEQAQGIADKLDAAVFDLGLEGSLDIHPAGEWKRGDESRAADTTVDLDSLMEAYPEGIGDPMESAEEHLMSH